jgi:hypothetical protein
MKPSNTTAIFNDKNFEHFGIHSMTAVLYGHKASEIREVELAIAEDQSRPQANDLNMEADYWGWWDEQRQAFTMIYAKYFLLNMCFPSGIKASEAAEQGRAYRLHVKLLSNISN